MLVEFSIIPIGTSGKELSPYLAPIVSLIETSGLVHEIHAAGTIVEGDGELILRLIDACIKAVMDQHPHGHEPVTRVQVLIKADISTAERPGAIKRKVESLRKAASEIAALASTTM